MSNNSSNGDHSDSKSKLHNSFSEKEKSTSKATPHTFARDIHNHKATQMESNNSTEESLQNENQSQDDSAMQIAHLEKKIVELEEKNNKLAFGMASLDNDNKRISRQAEETVKYSNSKIAKDLVDAMHLFDLGLKAVSPDDLKTDPKLKALFDGIQMTYTTLMNVLKKHGVEQIVALDMDFDSNLHDAISYVPSERKKGVVIEVLQNGYTLHGRVLVPATVVVSSGQ